MLDNNYIIRLTDDGVYLCIVDIKNKHIKLFKNAALTAKSILEIYTIDLSTYDLDTNHIGFELVGGKNTLVFECRDLVNGRIVELSYTLFDDDVSSPTITVLRKPELLTSRNQQPFEPRRHHSSKKNNKIIHHSIIGSSSKVIIRDANLLNADPAVLRTLSDTQLEDIAISHSGSIATIVTSVGEDLHCEMYAGIKNCYVKSDEYYIPL